MSLSDADKSLTWKCRRGMRELDVLLSGYLKTRFVAADSVRKQQFRDLLELSDPHIFALFTGRERSNDASIQQIVDCILKQSETWPTG